jgi:hypothetical protein
MIQQPDGRWLMPEPTNVNYPLLNPNFTRLEWYSFAAASNYHGLRSSFTRSFSQGLQFQASYTWSKAMDVLSTQFSGELGDSTVQNGFDPSADYGLSDFHVAHNFTGNFTYDLPFGTAGGVTGAVLGGWQLSGVLAAQSGLPLSVSGDPGDTHVLNRGGARPDLMPGGDTNPVYGNRDNTLPGQTGFLWFDGSQFIPQQPGYYGNLGRNTVTGPGVTKVDFSVLKNTRIGESKNLQFRAEFFNFFNTPEFSQPAADTTNQNIGRISSTRLNSARQVQLALRFEF